MKNREVTGRITVTFISAVTSNEHARPHGPDRGQRSPWPWVSFSPFYMIKACLLIFFKQKKSITA